MPSDSLMFFTLFCPDCLNTFVRLAKLLTEQRGRADAFVLGLEQDAAIQAVEALLGLRGSGEWGPV